MVPAGFGRRLAAHAVDFLALQLAVAIVFYVYAWSAMPPPVGEPVATLFPTPEEIDAAEALAAAEQAVLERVLFATSAFAAVALLAYLLSAHCVEGRTFGKRLLELRLLRADGRFPGAGAVLVRTVVGLVEGTVLLVVPAYAALRALAGVTDTFAEVTFPWDDLVAVDAVAGGLFFLFAVAKLIQSRWRRSAADVLTGTYVIREGYGSG